MVYFLLSRRGNRIYPRSFSCYMAETEFKSRLEPGMLVHTFSSSTEGKGGGRGVQRQEVVCEFKTSPVYISSSRALRAT